MTSIFFSFQLVKYRCNFLFFFWNCANGIKSKFDYIKYLAGLWNVSVFFIFESETRIRDLSILQIDGYDLILSQTINGNFNKARTVCYVKSDLPYKVLKIENSEILDLVALDIGNQRFIGLYRGFKLPKNESQTSLFHKILASLNKLCETNKTIHIGGDFNIDLFRKSSLLDHLENWAYDMGLNQLVDDFTRDRIVTKGNSSHHEKSAIDHFYSNSDNIKLHLESSVSDHKILLGTVKFNRSEIRSKITIRDWRNYSKEWVMEATTAQHPEQISNTHDLQNKLNKILDIVAPKVIVRVKPNQMANPKIEALKKRRDLF